MDNLFSPKPWQLAHGKSLETGPRALIMGILNVTPDSFSDGGHFLGVADAIDMARRMFEAGADIVDIGGESTRPGGTPVTAAEEQARIMPVIEALSAEQDMVMSVDTYRSQTARMAVAAGAHIINDVWGFQKDPELAMVAAETGAGVCAMHTGRERTRLPDVVEDQRLFLKRSIEVLRSAGVEDNAVILDPGFGFAKDPAENIALLARVDELHSLGFPLLIGTSRKRFIGHVTGQDAENRDIGTAATSVVARMKGGAVFRVHDVPVNRDALAIADAVLSSSQGS